MLQFFEELKRRNVFRVGIAYVVAAWLVIQVVETILPAFGFGDGAVRNAVIVLAIGFPLVLIFSWLFELTPEGLKLDRDADRSRPSSHRTEKNFDRAIIVVLALALGYFALDKFVIDPARDPASEESEALIDSGKTNSLAVLPFVNMSNDADNEYFSDGIAEELLNLLAKIPELRVISRSSSFAYKGRDIDIPSIAEELGVALVLEGSVRKYGNSIRITAQLIEAQSDTHLWSETYQRQLEDVFAIQDEISAAIVDSLRDTIGLDVGDAPTMTGAANKEAHDAYLRGQYLLAQRWDAVRAAVGEFEKAISLDPDYALAHAQLAIAYQLGYLDLSFAEMAASARPHVEKAMALDPSIAEAHAAAGQLSMTEGDVSGALEHFEKAIEINPNYADVYTWMANILSREQGRYAEAFAMREKAAQLDPLSIPAMFNYVDELIKRQRLAEADRELEKLASLEPSLYEFLRGLRSSLGGNWSAGALGTLEALRISPDNGLLQYALPYWLALMGLEKEAIGPVEEDADLELLALLGMPQRAAAVAQANSEEDGLVLAGAGDFVEARPLLKESWQSEGMVGPNFSVHHAAALIAVRRAAGNEDNVAELVAAVRDNARRYRESGITTSFFFGGADYEDGLASYLEGDEQRGLRLIARAVEDGYFIPPNEAYLQSLYQHPDFAAIRGMQEARQAREREKFLSVVCSDNPYAAVWEPAEETCRQFGVEGDD